PHADDRAVLHLGGRRLGSFRVARPLLRPEQRGALLPPPGWAVDPGGHPDRRLQQEDQQADGRRPLTHTTRQPHRPTTAERPTPSPNATLGTFQSIGSVP